MNKRQQVVSGPESTKKGKAIWFVQPESFNPREFLPSKLKWFADDARYVISLILNKMANRKVDGNDPIRLHTKHLRRVMHSRHYSAIVEALVEGGAVERSPYTVGKASFGYRLSTRFIGDKHVRVAARDPRLIQRIRKFYDRVEIKRRNRMKPVHVELARLQCQLQIDAEVAEQILQAIPRPSNCFDLQGILVQNIFLGEFSFNVGRFGRVTNSITSLKRELRTALRVNNEPIIGVDLSCAQPAFLATLVIKERERRGEQEGERRGNRERGSIYDAPVEPPALGDACEFGRLTQSGQFYEFMLDALKAAGSPMSRDCLKQRFLCDVLAKRKVNKHGAEYPSVVEDVYRSLFPTVYRFIRKVNQDGWKHENLIRELQRQESKLVIETVAADLVTAHPGVFFITLHDAIYTTQAHVAKVLNGFKRAFELTGFPMELKVEEPTNNS